MLGRLFKQSTPTSQPTTTVPHHGHHQQQQNPQFQHQYPHPQQIQSPNKPTSPPGLANSYEDAYTREILYGTHNANQLKPFQFNSKLFRIIISQDGGNLRSKQVLFDSACDVPSPDTKPLQHQHQQPLQDLSNIKKPSKPMVTSKVYHNVSDLNDYMFGCGLPSNENQSTTKIHTLPPLTNSIYGPYSAVLITRLFSISDGEFTELPNLPNQDANEWQPHPALRVKESSIRKVSIKDDSSKNNNVNSRFSIGVVIPLESICSMPDVIFNNWHEITHFMILLQKLIYKKLLMHLNAGLNYDTNNNFTGCQYLIKKRIQFPNYILQGDYEINPQLVKLIKTVHYNHNIPKLINSNALMKSSAENETFQYNPMLINWVLEVLNWLEFKDGKHCDYSTSFLASVFAILIRFRKLLSNKPFSNIPEASKEVTRVVVMTGNPVVAKKLIFILNGLVPNLKYVKISEAESFAHSDSKDSNDNNNDDDTKSNDNECTATSNNNTQPIPIQQQLQHTELRSGQSSSDNSLAKSVASMKGWEIPNKSATSITVDPYNVEKSHAVGIPIKNSGSHATTPGSLSMAYLSSSLNSSYSSSNYSLTKFGGSFIEKWKNSFGSGAVPSTSLGHSGSSGNMTGYFDDVVMNKRPSAASLRTPSPAVEFEDYTFQPLTKPINIVGSNNNNNVSSVSFQQQPPQQLLLSMTPSRLSRTQSMYDLYKQGGAVAGGVAGSGSIAMLTNVMYEEDDLIERNHNKAIPTLEIKRTKTSVYTPLIQDNMVKNIGEHDRSLIKQKCRTIMENKPKVSVPENNDKELEVQPTITPDETIFKHKGLLPVVAFSDEFRPEFSVQSCPLNPKLEQQVMSNMKNDLLFYQNNNTYEEVTSRTIFISLRAREIKLIEMNIKNDTGNSSNPNNNTYKTKIKKLFTPLKNSGNKELINKIGGLFFDINQLFNLQQLERNTSNVEITKKEFHDKLCSLVLQLIE
ncbi:Protein LST4 [Candida viswanathii]|uniref:Protein LST4 n=1 Tax=Candida viswanathii TaxID=5486 RepID=A0A367XMF8_9ASCO|nr:Protein LST4 [Candida viswanathii]